MRLERMIWIPAVLVMALGPRQAAAEELIGTPQVIEQAAVHATLGRPVGPFAARGPAPALHIGRRAQPDGRVLASDQSDMFMTYDTIQFSISMPEVAAGAVARLSIRDKLTKQEVCQAQKRATTGDPFLTFELGPGRLSPDDYVAVLTADGQDVTLHAFKVSPR